MLEIGSHLILLYAVSQNVLYIHRPLNSTAAFVCYENELCSWIEMTPHINYDQRTFSAILFDNTTKFRIKLMFNSKNAIEEFDWITFKTEKSYNYLNSSSESSVLSLLCYLTLCSTVLLIKCIVRLIKGKKCLLLVN